MNHKFLKELTIIYYDLLLLLLLFLLLIIIICYIIRNGFLSFYISNN